MAAPVSAAGSGNQNGGDEYVTAVASSSSPVLGEASEYVSASMETLAAIEKSKEQGWSEVADHVREGAAGASSRGLSVEDRLLWEKLKKEAPHLFVDGVEGLRWGRLIAVGGQAQIFEAWIGASGGDGRNPLTRLRENSEVPVVAKVFKMEGFSLVDLYLQWPRRKMACSGSRSISDPLSVSINLPATTVGGLIIDERIDVLDLLSLCNVRHGLFLEDGRFVFLMRRYDGDLRTLINLRLGENNNQGPPFSHEDTAYILFPIAQGMKRLHKNAVLHRDLKAANVLYDISNEGLVHCFVADYESSMMVQGTGFWRAPEVLEDLLKQPRDRNKEIWTEKVDVYGYAMTCYEVMTGHIPFYGYVKSDWKRVIDGERPHWPEYVYPQLRELVERCWHKEPSKRPAFDAIVDNVNELYRNLKGY